MPSHPLLGSSKGLSAPDRSPLYPHMKTRTPWIVLALPATIRQVPRTPPKECPYQGSALMHWAANLWLPTSSDSPVDPECLLCSTVFRGCQCHQL